MCIRDRRLRVRGGEPALVVVCRQPRQFGMRPERAAHVPAPVSYTHLRAHETVLDLVCRLLLEKKKKKLPKRDLSMHLLNTTKTEFNRELILHK